jgi:hypothetical protein
VLEKLFYRKRFASEKKGKANKFLKTAIFLIQHLHGFYEKALNSNSFASPCISG